MYILEYNLLTCSCISFRDHAKLLWKRIPGTVKVNNPEIGDLWEIGRKLWRRSFPEVYSLIKNRTWSPYIVSILTQLNGMKYIICILIVFSG